MRKHYGGLSNKYRDRLPVGVKTRAISLNEGNTPLIELHNIPKDLDRPISLYVKYEGMNPTGSFKDRGMTMAVTKAVEEGSQAIICASTGNTSAAAAAYAARAGIKAFVLIPDGKIAMGKLAQAMMHGSVVIQIKGNFDEGMRLVKEIAVQAPLTIVNSINPYRLQGQKTVAFEVIEQLGAVPDYHCLPVGNAGNITAHWMGYSECAPGTRNTITQACAYCAGNCPYTRDDALTRPKMVGYQASGAAPFIKGELLDNPETVATAIRIGNPASWQAAKAALQSLRGGLTSARMKKSSQHTNCSPSARGYSASRHRLFQWQGRYEIFVMVIYRQAPLWSVPSLDTGSKIPIPPSANVKGSYCR